MSLFTDVTERLRAIVFRRRLERELEEELRDHLERETEARARAGSADPRREALLALGGVEHVKEEVREARGVLGLEELVADTRYALRALRRNPGFALTVVAVLGIAIGAATSVFVVVHRVLLAELPYPEPGRLVRVDQQYGGTDFSGTLSVVDIQAVEEQQRTLEVFGAVRPSSVTMAGGGSPERIGVGRATSGFFRALGVRAAHGRLLEPRDDAPDAPPVVVVSHALAERALGGASMATGKSVTLDGVSHVVVGVLEPGRDELAGLSAQAWPVLQLETPPRRGPFGYRGVGRIGEGVTLDQARRDLAGISERIFPIWQASFQDSTATLLPVPLRDAVVGRSGSQIGLFAGAVALVLLLAVANVATLMLVRVSAREHELAVRMALGAGRRRVARLIVTECLVLTSLAALVALGVAWACVGVVHAVAPNLPRLAEVRLDRAGVVFALAVALASGLAVGLGPVAAAFARRAGPLSRLAGMGGRSGPGRRANRVRGAMVVAEFALALPLLVTAGLLLNSFLRLQRVDVGFDPAGVYALTVALPSSRYPDDASVESFWRLAEARIEESPGIAAAGLAGSLPPDNFGDVNNFDLLDKPVPPGTSQPMSPWGGATRGFFDALGVPLLEGRWFTLADSAAGAPVVLVSRGWAARFYPDESAVGKQLYGGGCTTCSPTTIVGVVGDIQYRGLTGETDAVYAPLGQYGAGTMNLVVRSRMGPAETFRTLRAAVASLDPELAPAEVVMTDRFDQALGDPRRWMAVVGAFAAAGVLLAALGIFGLMAYSVRQQQREMGVRLALGAAPGGLTRFVVARGMRYALAGTVIGLAIAVLATRWVESLLFGVGAGDPLTLALAVVALLAVGALACLVPGIRAARIRPVEALSVG